MKPIIFTLCASFMITLTIQGQTLSWAKQMGGSSDDLGLSIAIDASGNQYITGYFTGTADFDPGPETFNLVSAGEGDVFISKIDVNGNFVWAKRMGGATADNGRSIAVDVSGNVYITGSFTGTADFDPGAGTFNLSSAGSRDVFISKLDASGNFIWAKSFGGPTQEDHGYSIAVDASGNMYATGAFKGTIDFDPGPGTFYLTSGYIDAFIIKLNVSGNLEWAKKLGGGSTDMGYSIVVDAYGNVYTTGHFRGNDCDYDPGPGTFYLNTYGDSDEFILKLDASGNFVWAKQMRSGAYDYSYGNSIAVDASGNIYTTGAFKGTTDFDPGPGTFNLAAEGLKDGFVCKLNSAGDFVWAKKLGGCQIEDYGTHISADISGNIYTTGIFQYVADFDPGPAVYNLHASGGTDVFISKLNANGNFVWAKKLGGTNNDYSHSFALDASANNIYTTGYFSGTADFDPGTGTFNLSSFGGADIFVHKMNQGPPLPVKFSNVKAWPQNNGIRLQWSNLTETDVIDYSVERAGDIQQFEVLTRMPALKNDGGRADYFFFDASPLSGVNCYRIQSLETDGKKLYSVIVKVNIKGGKTGIAVYPNPVTTKQFSIEATGLPKGLYRVRIFNASGQQVHHMQLNMYGGSVSEMIQLPTSLKAGVYHLQVNNDELKLSKTFMVQ